MAKFKLTSGVQEGDIQREILLSLGEEQFELKADKNKVLRKRGKNLFICQGGMFWRANSGYLKGASGRPVQVNTKGMADIIGIVAGRPIAIEVKAEAGTQSKEQRQWQATWEAAGGLYVVARCPREALELVAVARAA